MDEPQNLGKPSKGASRQPNGISFSVFCFTLLLLFCKTHFKNIQGKPYRGTRAGKQVKMRNNCKKVAMLLNALSSECSKN